MTCGHTDCSSPRGLFRPTILGAATALLLGLSAGSANATVVTIDPSVLAPSIVGDFKADTYQMRDDATITIQTGGTFTETGTLTYLAFGLGNNTLSSSVTGLRNGTNGRAHTSTTYGLYLQFSAAGKLSGFDPAHPQAAVSGTFSSIDYTLYGNPGNQDTVSSMGNLNKVGTNIVVATGVMPPFTGVNDAEITGAGTPFSDILVPIVRTAAGDTYFLAPTVALFQEDTFTNTHGEFSFTNDGTYSILKILGGGGSGDFQDAPEPACVTVLGVGLLGLAALRRKQG